MALGKRRGAGPEQFIGASQALVKHLDDCATCGPVFAHMNGQGMLCSRGRNLANDIDRSVGRPLSF